MTSGENNNNAAKEVNEEREDVKISYELRSGQVRMFDVSRKSCEPFGFYFGERVKVRGGRKAWVVGVRESLIILKQGLDGRRKPKEPLFSY